MNDVRRDFSVMAVTGHKPAALLALNLFLWRHKTNVNVTSTPGHVLTTSLLRPKKIKDVVRTWYGLVGRGRNVVRT